MLEPQYVQVSSYFMSPDAFSSFHFNYPSPFPFLSMSYLSSHLAFNVSIVVSGPHLFYRIRESDLVKG